MDYNKEVEKYKKQAGILKEEYQIAIKWIYLLNNEISLTEKLSNKGINKIIIYGATEFAVRLVETCKNENFEVNAITDKRILHNGGSYMGIPLITIEELQKTDSANTYLVVTATRYYDEIKSELENINIKNVISLRDLLEGVI
jgi:hypothetical protein